MPRTDILQAIQNDKPFPLAPGEVLQLGQIQLVSDNAGLPGFDVPGGTLTLKIDERSNSGAGIYPDLNGALGSVGIAAKQTDEARAEAESIFVVLRVGYAASVTGSYSHPIGVLGSISGFAGSQPSGALSVITKVPRTIGALTALRNAAQALVPVRSVQAASDLMPGTWLVADAEGILTFRIAADLGYDLSFVRQINLLHISRSLDARIEAGIQTTFDVGLSSAFTVALSRETELPFLRLQLYRRQQEHLGFGVNLAVGVSSSALGDTTDFVKAVLGTHGLQVTRDLGALTRLGNASEPASPGSDLAQTPLRLPNAMALDLLRVTTGTDPTTELNVARDALLAQLDTWNELPPATAALLWQLFAPGAAADLKALGAALEGLADPDPSRVRQALHGMLSDASFPLLPESRWLASIAPDGVLGLEGTIDRLQKLAAGSQTLIAAGIMGRLHDFIEQHLDLTPVSATPTPDPSHLDPWLVNRLRDFLDEPLGTLALQEARSAISQLTQLAPKVQASIPHAFVDTLRFSLAASVADEITNVALLDATFDLDRTGAAGEFRAVIRDGKIDSLLVAPKDGVVLRTGILSHQIRRSRGVQLHLPFFDSKAENVNRGIGSVHVETNAGRVLVYQFKGNDQSIRANRIRCELSVMGKVLSGQMASGSIVYETMRVRPHMTLADLQSSLSYLLSAYFPRSFPDDVSIDRFYEAIRGNTEALRREPVGDLGDTAIDLQIAFPGEMLAGWFVSRDSSATSQAANAMSRALQRKLRELVLSSYLADLKHLGQNGATAALLIWAALPVTTAVTADGEQIVRLDTGTDVYWDWRNPDLRRAMIHAPQTLAALVPMLDKAAARWRTAGDGKKAAFFARSEVSRWLQLASESGDNLMQSLLFTEAELVYGAAGALRDIQAFHDPAADPARAINRLADFSSHVTGTFNKSLSAYSDPGLFRTLNSFLIGEASRVLAPAAAQRPSAMLTLYLLKDQRGLKLNSFLDGERPDANDVLWAQTLTDFPS